ncbi:DNA polymerase I [Microbacterium phage Caron]|uniref:DNA polymerase n=1 Tax=Microbacterium phage Caron TaxID=3028494 RepID=A0AAE9ZNP4_9CAUD|nr:DNA polymerase I [Microbacterium phage Caron]
MIHYTHTLAGDECHIYYPERRAELEGFYRFLAQGDKVLAIDTETSGLDTYAPGFELRLFQIGNAREAWVLRADLFLDVIKKTLHQPRAFTIHNAAFDLKVIDAHVGVPLEELVSRTFDTRIFAHLIDPRQESEGGAGLSLKPLSAIYVDENAPDTQAGLNAVFRTIKHPVTGKPCTKDNGWAFIPIDHPTYVRYAGLDVLLGARLFAELAPIIKELGLNDLSKFEHHLQGLLMTMERRGVLIDVPYVEKLDARLADEAEEFKAIAARYGVANVNSNPQIVEALLAMGETLTETTDSGAFKVDKGVLMPLADLDDDWNLRDARKPNPLADAVIRAKRAGKWRTSYVQSFLNLKDANDRIHPRIGGLQARTARMSISNPPLQQLPSGDWTIRRAMIADPGKLIIAADYSQVEMRVLAALCQDETLMDAIKSGTDLHDFTAARVFGPDFTKRQRKVAKAIGFGKVYGGGAATVSRQTGVPIPDVKPAMAAYDATFPGIKRYGARLQSRAQYGKREVITVSGRHLPLDRDRLYAATNYVVQSTARDLLAQAIVDIFDAGLGDTLLLPVHDELIAQADAKDAEEVIHEIGRLMESTFYTIPIISDPEVYGRSWGSGYNVPEGLDAV